jgi:hypothetical protein
VVVGRRAPLAETLGDAAVGAPGGVEGRVVAVDEKEHPVVADTAEKSIWTQSPGLPDRDTLVG